MNGGKLFIIKENTQGFKEGEIVKSFNTQPYYHKTVVTNYKIIGKWSCCGCNKYKSESVLNKYLIYLDEF